MASIECNAISKSYGAIEVVSNFNLNVIDQEFIVFLGPSGCGKSTILRMLAGLEDITGGELKIAGNIVNGVEPRDRGIAMVFQNYALYPHMSIRDNIAFGLRRIKTPEAEISTRVEHVTTMLGLSAYLDRIPTELSGGQQQRVAIARAMIKTPEVFLFDEPLSNLDAKLRAHMRIEIARLHKQLKTTSVYVTHDQMEAMTLADRIVLLNRGNIEQVGTPAEIYEYPESLFVAGFIGTPAMNLQKARVSKTSAGWDVVLGSSRLAVSNDRFNLSEGQDVVMGIRPSKLQLIENPLEGKTISGLVDFVEFHGDNLLVGLVIDGKISFTAFVDARYTINEGRLVHFLFDEEHIHLFDANTKRALLIK
ncbi:MAG: ABC transporter ATP-binding protein [Granulosicoccus sp.]